VRIEAKTKRYLACPGCGKTDLLVEHLFEYDIKVGPWWCHECGAGWEISQTGGNLEIERYPKAGATDWLLLELPPQKESMFLRVPSFRSWPREEGDAQYLVEEHSCPIDLLRTADELWLGAQKDPHGILQLVNVHDKREDASPVMEAAKVGE
jgi:hypothetical protein